MKVRLNCVFWLLGFLSSLGSCWALFEDQSGLWDWHQQLLGRVKFARFHTYGAKKRVLVASDANTLASLNLRTGEIVWRKLLASTDSIDQLEIHGKYLLALSKASSAVRAWTIADGLLAWETIGMGSQGRSSSSNSIANLLSLPVDVDKDGMNDLAVLFDEVVHVLSSADGRTLWQHTLRKDSGTFYHMHAEAQKKRIFAVGIGANQQSVQVAVLDAKSGDELDFFNAPSTEPLQSSSLSLGGSRGLIAVTSASGNALFTGDIFATSFELEQTPVRDLAGPGAHSVGILPSALEGAFALSMTDSDGAVAIVHVAAGGVTPTVLGGPAGLFPLSERPAVSASVDLGEGQGHVFGTVASVPSPGTASTEAAVVHFNVMGLGGASVVEKEVVIPWVGRGRVTSVFLNVYPRKDGGNGFRALVVGEDDSLALLQQGEVVWVREEGLASILGVQMVDLPLPHGGDSHRTSSKAVGGEGTVEHNLQEWLKDHWVKAKVALILATEEEKTRVAKQRQSSNDKTGMTSDHNGFRKLIVAATRSGKVYALHNGDGRVVWSAFPSPFVGSAVGGKRPEVLRIFLSRVPHRSALDTAPAVLLLSRAAGSGSDKPGILTTLDAHTGAELASTHLPFAVKQAIQLPYVDASETRLLLLIDGQHRAHIFPSTADAARAFAPHASATFFYEVEPSGWAMSGYAIIPGGDGVRQHETEGAVYDTEKIWSLAFAEEAEVVATVAARRPDEVAHALTKVLGNRDVLYKYLNRNTIFVATVTPAKEGPPGTPSQLGSSGSGTAGGDEMATLMAYVIDAVTGQVLYRVAHPGMQGPVHAVLSENWVVYHYFNIRQHRFEVSVLELYDEDALQTEKSVLNILKETITGAGSGSHNASFLSSFAAPSLRVLGQSYYFSRSVKVLAVTVTGKGITGKHVLFGTGTDQVLAMEKRFLDPRRPTTALTNSDREEGLIPYADTLPIIATSYLTQNKAVEGLRGIATVPARLESSCLVFVYGLDLFYSRTAPSRDYDTLGEDFSFALLLGTFVIILLGIVVTWVLGTRRELSLRWQ